MGSYKFILKQNVTFFVRFHFFSFKAQSFDLKDANFSFIVGGKLVMNNFNVNFKHSSNDSNDAIIKEFILKVESVSIFFQFQSQPWQPPPPSPRKPPLLQRNLSLIQPMQR
jgi:hypothetical protein